MRSFKKILILPLGLNLVAGIGSATELQSVKAPQPKCELFLQPEKPYLFSESEKEACLRLRDLITTDFRMGEDSKVAPLIKNLNRCVEDSRFSLAAAIAATIGPENIGKSTLVNAILALIARSPSSFLKSERYAFVSDYAGVTNEMMLLLPQDLFANGEELLERINGYFDRRVRFWTKEDGRGVNFRPHNHVPVPIEKQPDIVAVVPQLLKHLGIIDTPGFNKDRADKEVDAVRGSRMRAAVRGSEVLILMITQSNQLAEDHIDLIRAAFEEFGVRKMIIVYQDLPWSPRAEVERREIARKAIYRLANKIYKGDINDVQNRPAELIGSYFMPAVGEVRDETEHPELIPVTDRDRDLRTVLEEINNTFVEHKTTKKRETIDAILAGGREIQKEVYRQRYLKDLVLAAHALRIQTFTRRVVQSLAFDAQYNQILRESLKRHSLEGLVKFEYNSAAWLLSLFTRWGKARPGDVDAVELERSFASAIGKALDELVELIDKDQVIAVENLPEFEKFKSAFTEYRQYMEAAFDERGLAILTPDAEGRIQLPGKANLDPAMREKLIQLKRLNNQDFKEKFIAELKAILAGNPYLEAVAKANEERGRLGRVYDKVQPAVPVLVGVGLTALDIKTVGLASTVFGALLPGNAALATLLGAGVGTAVVGTQAVKISEDRRLHTLRQMIEEQHTSSQIKGTEKFMAEDIAKREFQDLEQIPVYNDDLERALFEVLNCFELSRAQLR